MLISSRPQASGDARERFATPLGPEGWALAGILVLAAVLRFVTLGSQSYWFDEAQAAHEFQGSLGSVLHSLYTRETNPPLYFVLGWLWAKVFGTGEVALRSLSALAGVAAVALIYKCGEELVSRRAGLVAAGLAAINPFMIWYSQEAREYMLVAALSAASLLWFARALRTGAGRSVAWWAGCSALALLTHFFAAFLVWPEAAWLLYVHRRRATLAACGALLAVQAALLPLAFT
ncbi:MAG TPA: glycosyltransferase family 39 protein, partial [Solirubrobacteraceae bacterium]|nr:glycosyltransferase family 39 protein [Solirubrobacteraceae bacterium]